MCTTRHRYRKAHPAAHTCVLESAGAASSLHLPLTSNTSSRANVNVAASGDTAGPHEQLLCTRAGLCHLRTQRTHGRALLLRLHVTCCCARYSPTLRRAAACASSKLLPSAIIRSTAAMCRLECPPLEIASCVETDACISGGSSVASRLQPGTRACVRETATRQSNNNWLPLRSSKLASLQTLIECIPQAVSQGDTPTLAAGERLNSPSSVA